MRKAEFSALIVGAGRGTRAGTGLPKQFRLLCGQSVLEHVLTKFMSIPEIGEIILVYNPCDQKYIDALKECYKGRLKPLKGGKTRAASVRAGLAAVTLPKVLIHDCARPLVSTPLILSVMGALEHNQGAAPALAVTDALWQGKDGMVEKTIPRAELFRAQTPQGFLTEVIRRAHAMGGENTHGTGGESTDDVEIARQSGVKVVIVPGEENNLKLTYETDFIRAAQIMSAEKTKIRLGNGYDVHAFTHGDGVTLCGVKIPWKRALMGHSDADVGMHAITDALYGALAKGDIGRHFPPNDPQWKGASSEIFLRHAAKMVTDEGYRISNIDCTLICEAPKIAPHACEMRTRLAEIMEIDIGAVSVKATTSEGLGFTGRKEGIAAMASATLAAK